LLTESSLNFLTFLKKYQKMRSKG